jgi:hypothetical protein
MHRLHLAVGFQQVQGGGEVAAYVLVQLRPFRQPGQGQQRGVGDDRRVDGAAFAVLAGGVLVDALGEPVVDTA